MSTITADGKVCKQPSGSYIYHGDWDGVSFKEEVGCTNPAFILADLMERTGARPDWVTGFPALDYAGRETDPSLLHWRMLYDWGSACDELIMATPARLYGESDLAFGTRVHEQARLRPRFTVNTICSTHEDMVTLRETLRMHCLSWQSTDPRYRTSWPGLPLSARPGHEA